MAKTPGITLLTPPGILSYPNLFEPRAAFPNQAPKYSATLLVEKTRAKELDPLRTAIVQVAMAHFTNLPVNPATKKNFTVEEFFKLDKLYYPLKDGDVQRPGDKAYAGRFAFAASTDIKHRPTVVGPDGQPLMSPDEIYPGCLARFRVYVCPFEQQVKKGVTLRLNGVQKLRDGDRLDGKVTTFEAWTDDAAVDPMG